MPENSPPTTEKLSISRKVIIGAGITLLMLAMIAVTSFMTTRRLLEVSQKIAERRQIQLRSELMQRHIVEMENGVRGFMLSGKDDMLVPYTHGFSFIIDDITSLSEAVGNAEQATRLARLRELVGDIAALFGSYVSERRAGGIQAAVAIFNDPETAERASGIFSQMSDELVEFDQFEKRREAELQESREEIARVNTSLVLGGTSLTYISLLIACLLILRDIRERRLIDEQLELERNLLRRMMDTIPDQIYVKDLSGRYVRSNTAHAQFVGRESAAHVEGRTDAAGACRALPCG